jgi:hypothetical protein
MSIENTTAKAPAIIVFRHGCDGGHSDKETNKYPSNVSITLDGKPQSSPITIHDNWLGPDGLKQATNLGAKLPIFLADYAPVNLIVTEGPGNGRDGTPNPLNTVTPFLVNQAMAFPKQQFKLEMRSSNAYVDNTSVFSVSHLIGDGNSAVICWEALGMWRKCKYDKDKQRCGYDSSLLLGSLASDSDNPLLNYSPNKGNTVYVFTAIEGSEKCNLAVFSFDGINFNPITGSSLPSVPACHCNKHGDAPIPSDCDCRTK